jgi:hypothetical protein
MFKLNQSEVEIFEKFENKSNRPEIIAKFIAAGTPSSTEYRQYARLILGNLERKSGSRLSRSKFNNLTEKKSWKRLKIKFFCPFSALGRFIGVSDVTAKSYMERVGIRVQKRKVAPKVTPDQAQRQKTC